MSAPVYIVELLRVCIRCATASPTCIYLTAFAPSISRVISASYVSKMSALNAQLSPVFMVTTQSELNSATRSIIGALEVRETVDEDRIEEYTGTLCNLVVRISLDLLS